MKTGIFFDGYHCQKFWNETDNDKKSSKDKQYNKIDFAAVIIKIKKQIQKEENKKLNIIYKAWFQGICASHIDNIKVMKADTKSLQKIVWKYHNERTRYIQLIRHGVESIFLEHAYDETGKYKEKGIDGALTVNCINNVNNLDLECVIICTNDSDHEPLLHNLSKRGVYTVVVSFNPPEIVANRLKRQCDFQFEFR
jgi:uncharacterized LabA/DUF88 family protein